VGQAVETDLFRHLIGRGVLDRLVHFPVNTVTYK